jgi:alkanesulfonate monooxygenase SsuD/methylene tetrahydromethanopterin reductase-like flavin-dependent oxidoreductase (luciferase family)
VSGVRIGALLVPSVTWPALAGRCLRLESLGVTHVWVDDHAANPAKPDGKWADCFTTLAGLAASTSRIRIGPLVANPILRHPAVLARQALTVDQISGGRLEVGIGSGYAETDHAFVGEAPWPPEERQRRFAEAVAVVDALLRGEPSERAEGVRLQPASPQRPRPPLTVAAHGPRALDVAARHADRWISYGGWDLKTEELLDRTRRRADRLDARCAAHGRDPRAVRRALLAGNPAATREPIWSSTAAFEEFAGRVGEAGIDELVVYYPPHAMYPRGAVAEDAFERVVADLGTVVGR